MHPIFKLAKNDLDEGKNMLSLYRIKVSLLEPHRPINELQRIIEVRSDLPFNELKQTIIDYFNCDYGDAWQFVIAREKMDNFGKLKTCKAFVSDTHFPKLTNDDLVHLADVNFDKLQLALKDYVYLWLMPDDAHGADLVFRLRIEKISPCSDGVAKAQLVKSLGELPMEFASKLNPNKGEFEATLLSALMLIATGGNGDPVRWQELVDNGVADELVKRNLIKPCINPSHVVRMTAYGESELIRVMELLGLMGNKAP